MGPAKGKQFHVFFFRLIFLSYLRKFLSPQVFPAEKVAPHCRLSHSGGDDPPLYRDRDER